MINLKSDSLLARWFVWSCDHLPFTGTRKGNCYLSEGTTLCHIFWAILWVPLLAIAFVGFFSFVMLMLHIAAHDNFIASKSPGFVVDHPLLSFGAYFMPEAVALGMVGAGGLIIFACIGGSKVGFFQLLWQYLKSIKHRVCPLVRFDGNHASLTDSGDAN